MNTRRWTPSKKRPTAAEQRAITQQKALDQCKQGNHQLRATFRPGEQVCTVCAVVFYCPGCLKENNLSPAHSSHDYAIDCAKHQKAEVQR